MRLLHHPRTNEGQPFEFRPDQKYVQVLAHKPAGFWVSDNDGYGWREWCRDNEFCTDSVDVAWEVELIDNHTLLVLDHIGAMEDFTRTYAKEWPHMENFSSPMFDLRPIDWPAVAERYGGILITPYQWSHRMSLHWYYGWDCASGCVWDLSQIKSVELLAEVMEVEDYPTPELESDRSAL